MDDLYGQLLFLRCAPLARRAFFNNVVKTAFTASHRGRHLGNPVPLAFVLPQAREELCCSIHAALA